MTTIALGKFTQTDPLQADVGSAFESAYVYAGNNPAVYSDPSGLRKKAAGSNVGRKLVVKHRGLINSMSQRYGLNPEVAALILMEENNFGRNMNFLSAQAEQMDPFGDSRTGIANLHSWDLAAPLDAFTLGGVRSALGDDLLEAGRKRDKTRRPSAEVDAAVERRFASDPTRAIRWSQTDEELNIKILILNLASTDRNLEGPGAGPLSRDEALVLSRKTGGGAAADLYNGKYKAYNDWLAGPPYSGDGRLTAGPGRRPDWLSRYDKYNPSVLL